MKTLRVILTLMEDNRGTCITSPERELVMSKNTLKAVFWDYPELCDLHAVDEKVKKAREKHDTETLRWLMARFLERGRVRDTTLFFRREEVRDMMKDLRISPRARRRWERLLQVYGNRG